MADLLLRNVPPQTLDALKARARNRKRSVQAEALELLEHGVAMTAGETLLAWAETVRGAKIDSSAAVAFLREMRDGR